MCRGCLFVQVDESSGDIDGCWKDDIFDDLLGDCRFKPEEKAILQKLADIFVTWANEDVCFEGLKQSQPKTKEEFDKQCEEWWKARARAVRRFQHNLRILAHGDWNLEAFGAFWQNLDYEWAIEFKHRLHYWGDYGPPIDGSMGIEEEDQENEVLDLSDREDFLP